MKSITAEGAPFIYFARGEDVSKVGELGLDIPLLEPFMSKRLEGLPQVRLILVPHRPGVRSADAYYLHWNDGRNLDELDRKVELGTYTDDDFAPSIMSRYQHTWCRNCDRRWHTLIVPPDIYIGVGDLFQRKIGVRRSDFKNCPACKGSLRQMVIQIF